MDFPQKTLKRTNKLKKKKQGHLTTLSEKHLQRWYFSAPSKARERMKAKRKLHYKTKELVFKRPGNLAHVSLSPADQHRGLPSGGDKSEPLYCRDRIDAFHGCRDYHKKVRALNQVLSHVDPLLFYGVSWLSLGPSGVWD